MARGSIKWTVGIDEVGRGALAGPVVVAVALLPSGKRMVNHELGMLKDSKQLSAPQREAWFSHFKKDLAVDFAVARVYPRGIERINISQAANLAAHRAFLHLCKTNHLQLKNGKIYLDGGLFLKSRRDQPKQAKTLVKADERIAAVKIASIIAKVTRDRFMCRLAKRYAAYGFDVHKGYGTAFHRKAIAKHGPSVVHRLTFLKAEYRI